MPHFVSTKPFFILTGVPNNLGFVYGANGIGEKILCNEAYTFTEYDTEAAFADAVDALKGEPGWYWRCENRTPSPPNPNDWSYVDCKQAEPDEP